MPVFARVNINVLANVDKVIEEEAKSRKMPIEELYAQIITEYAKKEFGYKEKSDDA